MKTMQALSRFRIVTALLLCALTHLAWADDVVLIPGGFTNLPTGSPNWRYRLGTNEASTPVAAWRSNSFLEDATWSTGTLPLGYVTGTPNDPNGYEAVLVTAVPPPSTTSNLSVFVRKTFVVTNRLDYIALKLGVMVDDGMVAWINGQEITPRFQCCQVREYLGANPAIPSFDSGATTTVESAPATNTIANDINGPLVDGTNVLCIQLFNGNLTSSDLVLDAVLIGVTPDTNAPTIFSRVPAPGTVGSLSQVTVTFSEAVTGVQASDLLINNVPASGVSGGGSSYTFTFPQPPLGTVEVKFIANPEIVDGALNEFDASAPAATWQYTLIDNVAPTIVSRSPTPGTTVETLTAIQVNFSEPVQGVDATDLLINNVPVTNLVVISPSIYRFEFPAPATGVVSIAFAPGHGITDLAASPNAFAGASWSNIYNPNFQFTAFIITEFMASNGGDGPNALRDEDGDTSDWIEIYNPDNTVANLGGYFITDAANNLTKWTFPVGTTVPARGYIVIFASGKNRTNVQSRLHTNFQLNNSGEYLGLLTPRTNVVSDYFPTYPNPQLTDVSYGRDRNNPALKGYYTTPTPGAHNILSGEGFGPDVVFTRNSGTFLGTFQLSLGINTTNAVIRYTLITNAQDFFTATNIPTASSLLYTGPITVYTTMQVRARSFPLNTNQFPGAPKTESYIQLTGGVTNFVSTLPLVVIHTVNSTAFSGGFPAGDNSVIVAFFETNAAGQASLLHEPQKIKRAGINLRGSSTQGYPKSSYAVELWDEFNADKEEEVLGLPQESDWVLYAPNYFDRVLIHNPLMHELGKGTGRYSSRYRFVEVFVRNGPGAVNANMASTGGGMGDYNGIYVLEEKVKRDASRVDIDVLEPENTNSPAITGGYLLKYDRKDANERTFTAGGYAATETTGGVGLSYQEPDGLEMITPARVAQSNYLTSYINLFYASITGSALTNNTGTNHYSNYFDIDASVDHNIIGVITLNADAMRLSGYIYKPRNGKLAFGPVWDVDRGLGTGDSAHNDWRGYNPRCWVASNPLGLGGTDFGTDFFNANNVYPNRWYERLFQDPDFWQKWIDRWQELRASAWTSNNVLGMVDSMGALLTPAQPREVARWGANGASDTRPRNATITSPNGDYSHVFNGTFQGELNFQKRWLGDRIYFIDTNLLARPGLSQAPGLVPAGTMVTLVDLTGKPGTKIYYTLNGTDPRAPKNLTNAAAIEYTGPITISNNVRITARAINGNHRNLTGTTPPGGANHANPPINSIWSGVISETFFTAVPPLIVTELMYHPAAVTEAGNTNDADNYEYIELRNVGTNTLNLAGYQFTNGITFTFGSTIVGPGGFVTLAKDLNAFLDRYGSVPLLRGPYLGNFDNAGERVTLVGAALEPVLDFTYSDEWYPLTDGAGFSLVAIDDSAPNNLSTNTAWRTSSTDFGSPGASNPPPIVHPIVLVNEALTHTDPAPPYDTIELYNPNPTPVNVGGWWLTDEFDTPRKYQITNPTTIPAGGYVTFDELQFNVGPDGFALGSDGDQVWLFSGTNGSVTTYYHGFDFGAAQNGRTFGRYVNSQGAEHFVAQATNTLGTNNSLPLVGPIVISEIMYHPPEAGSGTNVFDNSLDEYIELYNLSATNVPLYHTLFPSNTWKLTSAVDYTFPTNVVIGPSNFVLVVSFDPLTNGAAFRAKYGVPETVPLFGPYDGKLDNSAESVRIRRPDNPNGIDVPYILVDQVDYEDVVPWSPVADGFGASLQRIVLKDYGNDPTNWTAARTTPGSLSEGGAPPVIVQQPVDISAVEGMTTNISVVVSSATALTFQWRLNGVSVPGATNSTLVFPAIQLSEAGTYTVSAFNDGGAVFSTSAVVTVSPLPVITQQPQSQNVNTNVTFTLTVAATGTGPVRYQWRFNGINIAGATNTSLTYSNAELFAHAGYYDALVTDDIGTRASQVATIIVLARPFVIVPPASKVILKGQDATFSVIAGPIHPLLPLYYRWLTNGTLYQSNLVPTVFFPNNQTNKTIRLIVGNIVGPGTVNLNPITLFVFSDDDGDSMADVFENTFLGGTNAVPGGDADGDTFSNLDEFLADTNPTNALSYLKLDLVSLNTNQAVLQFEARSNHVYRVDTRDNIEASNWTNLVEFFAVNATNRIIRVTNSVAPPMRLYRLGIPLE
jgi:hypothetical protein